MTRRDREDQGRFERGHKSSGVEKHEIGKHVGALGGNKDVHPVHDDAHKLDTKSRAPDPKAVQPSNSPLQKLKNAAPSFKGKGKG